MKNEVIILNEDEAVLLMNDEQFRKYMNDVLRRILDTLEDVRYEVQDRPSARYDES